MIIFSSNFTTREKWKYEITQHLLQDAPSSIIHNSNKVGTIQCPSADEWIHAAWFYVHTMEYHSAKERNEGLKHATKWMNCESMMLSEAGKIHLYWYCRISCIWNVQNRQSCSERKYISSCWGLGLGRIRSDFQRAWSRENSHSSQISIQMRVGRGPRQESFCHTVTYNNFLFSFITTFITMFSHQQSLFLIWLLKL